MRPFLEKVLGAKDASFTATRLGRNPTIPFEWHHHPEFELTLTTNSRGHRFIGDHIGTYDDGDLVMVGPHVPHTWVSSGKIDDAGAHNIMVMWFRPEWTRGLTGLLTELQVLDDLFARSSRGLQFSAGAAARARPVFESIFDKPPEYRFVDLITILLTLAADSGAVPLATPANAPANYDPKPSRIDRVLEYIHVHYRDEIRVEDLTRIAALSVSSFHRMFKRHTRMTLSAYVMQLRVGEACALLVAGDHNISVIAEAAGYRSLANFNRQFMALKGMAPRRYRDLFQK